MHYIKVPEDIQLKGPASKGGQNLDKRSFLDWMLEIVLNDPRGADGGPVKVRRWQKVIDKFEKYGNPGDIVVLENEDYRRINEIVAAPQIKYGSLLTVQFLPFFDAISEASEKDPRPPPEPPPIVEAEVHKEA